LLHFGPAGFVTAIMGTFGIAATEDCVVRYAYRGYPAAMRKTPI